MLGNGRRVAPPDPGKALVLEGLHAQRHEPDISILQLQDRLLVHIGWVGLDADVARQSKALPHPLKYSGDTPQGQRRRPAADVYARHFRRTDRLRPPVDLGERSLCERFHQPLVVGDFGIRAVWTETATEGHVQIEGGAVDAGWMPSWRRRFENPGLLRTD